MGWAETFIAVDWGTTNRRAWRIEAGKATREFEDGSGVLSLERDAFADAVAEIRTRLGDHPMVMAGMVGSNRGWVEAPYVPCPAGLDDLVDRLCWPEPGRTAIAPGLCCFDPPDVMRGEEVQILGAVDAGLVPGAATVCHPGTHNKWVRLRSGEVTGFRTVMTGEMFNLLKEHSILSDLMGGNINASDVFREGVRRGLDGGVLTAELFSVRAAVILGKRGEEDAADFVSGLLIGTDLIAANLDDTDPIFVMGRPDLTRLYAAALDVAGRDTREIDGETAFLAGSNAIARRLS